MKCHYKDVCGHYQETAVCCNDSIECEFCGIYKELKREEHGFKND